jgi:hypothetical protein
LSDVEIGRALGCTPKQVHKRWVKLLELAWQVRNGELGGMLESDRTS